MQLVKLLWKAEIESDHLTFERKCFSFL